jgi:DNA-binding LacI/PurR family transcriptional regulator
MNKKITMKDVADDAGLSISTVSRALTGNGKISKENQRIVFESARRLNYPLAMVSTPAELRDELNIALVTRHYSGEFFAMLIAGFDAASEGTPINMNMVSVSHTDRSAAELLRNLKNRQFDGAIIFLPDLRATDYMKLLECLPSDFPLVSIAPLANSVIDTVTFDNYRGGYLVARHFEEQGYTKLGLIQGPVNRSEAMLRKNGFIDYVNASEHMELVWDFSGDYSVAMGKQAYKYYSEAHTKPQAIFCSNDDTAIGFMHNAIRDGVHIPNDVALAGFDDLRTCELYTPSLTSVHTSYELLGKKAFEIILDRIKNGNKTAHSGFMSLVPVSLTVRESSTELTGLFENHYKAVPA